MAEAFDKQLEIAAPYATALFALAREAGQADEVRGELEELARLSTETDPALAAFFSSRALNDDYRAAILEKTFRGKLSDLTLNTLQVMNAHSRTDILPALLRQYVLRQEEAAGQVEAVAISAAELDEPQRQAVAAVAAQVSGKKPLIEYQVDPTLVGGLILQIGDLRYDNSVRRQLAEAHERLKRRSERGLEVGTTE